MWPAGAVFRCDMILAHSRYAGQLNVSDMFTRLMLSLVATGIAPRSFYIRRPGTFNKGALRRPAVDFIAEAIATLGANATDGFHTYNVVNPHVMASLGSVRGLLIDAGHAIRRINDYGDWLTRFENAMRALPDRQRQHSELNLLGASSLPLKLWAGQYCPLMASVPVCGTHLLDRNATFPIYREI